MSKYRLPQFLILHRRELFLYHVDRAEEWDTYRTVLQAMPRLRAIYFQSSNMRCSYSDSIHLASWSHGLEHLTLTKQKGLSYMTWPGLISLTQRCAPPLRSLHVLSEIRLRSVEKYVDAVSGERDGLERLLDGIHHSVERLLLPGESLRLSQLSAAVWPSLIALSICGICPELDDTFLHVLSHMPCLRELEVAVAQLVDAAPLLIWPRGAGDDPDLGRLRRFALAFPHHDDAIFDHLPSTLESLSLCDMPRYYNLLSWNGWTSAPPRRYGAPLMCSTGALSIFRRFSGPCLRSLELVLFADEREHDALAQIAMSCPNLRIFELHRYRAVDPLGSLDGDPETVPVVRCENLCPQCHEADGDCSTRSRRPCRPSQRCASSA